MRIRSADARDAPALAALVEGHPLFERYGVHPPSLAARLAHAIDRGEPIAVATEGTAVRGFAWWTPTGAFARSPYLRLLVVASDATGAGVGARLLDAVEAAAFGVATDLFALANVENAGARRFYARRGYAEVGRLDDYVAPGLHEVVIRKRKPAGP